MTWLVFIWTWRKPLAALLLIAGLYGLGYYKGASTAAARCHDAELNARIASLQRDLDARRKADAYEELARSHITAGRDALRVERDAYRTHVDEVRSGDLCPYDRDELGRLRKLRGWQG